MTTLTAVALIAFGCGGANRSLYADAGKAFGNGYEAGHTVLSQEIEAAPKVHRMLWALEYLGRTPGDLPTNEEARRREFGKFVCAGTGAYGSQRVALEVLSAYGHSIADVSASPSKDIGALWASIKKLREPKEPLGLPEQDPDAASKCVNEVVRLYPGVSRGGQTQFGPAAVGAAYTAIVALANAVEKGAVAVLTAVDDAARAKAIKQIVDQNSETIDKFLKEQLNEANLTPMFDQRKTAALVTSSWQFRRLLLYKREGEELQIVEMTERVHASLAEFDALGKRTDPSKVAAAMRQAQAELKRLAAGDLTLEERWASLQTFASQMGDIAKAAEDVKSQTTKTIDTLTK